ncbi:TPA: hypothetical protein N0F65_001253 [Lagenidium giganteum]|uniref:Transmembrane protein n=1 Tax=Lagenidium giganteum TaxID=4803 RepID=A0AAV2YV11_9STRA|nr:TPA: hypothetical protein N0F65_001253 [Lagenidium giganteum]
MRRRTKMVQLTKPLIVVAASAVAVIALHFALRARSSKKSEDTPEIDEVKEEPKLTKSQLLSILDALSRQMAQVVRAPRTTDLTMAMQLAQLEAKIREASAKDNRAFGEEQLAAYLMEEFEKAIEASEREVYAHFQTTEEDVKAATEHFGDDEGVQAAFAKIEELYRMMTRGADNDVEVPEGMTLEKVRERILLLEKCFLFQIDDDVFAIVHRDHEGDDDGAELDDGTGLLGSEGSPNSRRKGGGDPDQVSARVGPTTEDITLTRDYNIVHSYAKRAEEVSNAVHTRHGLSRLELQAIIAKYQQEPAFMMAMTELQQEQAERFAEAAAILDGNDSENQAQQPSLNRETLLTILDAVCARMGNVVLQVAKTETIIRQESAQKGEEIGEEELGTFLMQQFDEWMQKAENEVYAKHNTTEDDVKAATEYFESDEKVARAMTKLNDLYAMMSGNVSVEVPEDFTLEKLITVMRESMEGLSAAMEETCKAVKAGNPENKEEAINERYMKAADAVSDDIHAKHGVDRQVLQAAMVKFQQEELFQKTIVELQDQQTARFNAAMAFKPIIIGAASAIAALAIYLAYSAQSSPKRSDKDSKKSEDGAREAPSLPKEQLLSILETICTQMGQVVMQLAKLEGKLRQESQQTGRPIPEEQLATFLMGHFDEAMKAIESQVYAKFQTTEDEVRASAEYFEEAGDKDVANAVAKLQELFRVMGGAEVESTVEVPADLTLNKFIMIMQETMESLNVAMEEVCLEVKEQNPEHKEEVINQRYVQRAESLSTDIHAKHGLTREVLQAAMMKYQQEPAFLMAMTELQQQQAERFTAAASIFEGEVNMGLTE